MEPYLLCVIFWALLYGLARVLSEHDTSEATALAKHDVAEETALGEHDISENNESPNWPLVLLLILNLMIVLFAFYYMVLDAGEICIGFGQTCS